MSQRSARIIIRKRETTGGSLPVDALMGEIFGNLYDGVVRLSGTTGGSFEPSSVSSIFEVGSKLYNSFITNRLNVNNNFIVSGGTGIISTYNGQTALSGKFLSGTSQGFVIANISDIQGIEPYVQNGTNTFTGGTTLLPTVNITSATLNNLSTSGTSTANSFSATTLSGGTILSGSTNLYNIFATSASIQNTYVQNGVNVFTGGTLYLPTVNLTSATLNNLSTSGTNVANQFSATTFSGGTIYSGNTNIETIIYNIANSTESITLIKNGTNTFTGGTATLPSVNITSATLANLSTSGTSVANSFSATTLSGGTIMSGSTNLGNLFLPNGGSLTLGQVAYVGTNGLLKTETGFEYEESNDLLKVRNITIGSPSLTGITTIYGDVLIIGDAISGFTSELYIEDNRIELNYNPTASTVSKSLGSGFSIQDGSGDVGTDVFWDVRGTTTGVANRSFTTNLDDIRVRESGTESAPNGKRLIAEDDIINGGSY